MDENLKMIILGFNDPKFQKPAFLPPFKAHVNPESYTQSVNIQFSETQAQGTSSGEGKHSHTEPGVLRVELLLDRTGALGNLDTGPLGVEPDILLFKELTLHYEGSIHKPRYLLLLWGSLIFRCQLQNLDIEYKMFNKFGVPVRAVLKAVFREFVETSLRALLERKSSPDLTHRRTVKEGDTLPMMAFEVYGDSSYYLEVARVNNIVNFRHLKPGTEIYFPPIDKTEVADA